MGRCYYCNGQIPNMPWHYRDPYLRRVVRICDRCYNEREEKEKNPKPFPFIERSAGLTREASLLQETNHEF